MGRASVRPRLRTALVRLLPVGLLGAGAAVLISCGGSSAGLIPSEDAGPLVADFQAVERAATKGSGDCGPTRAALSTTERDFQSLPASIDAGLRRKLQEGIAHLQTLALELCAQPLSATTGESTTTAPPPAKTKSTPPPSAGETTGTTGAGGTTPPSAATPPGEAEGGTAPETEGNGEGSASEHGEHSGEGGAAAGGGGGHEDNGLGNSGVSGNGGTGPGGH